MDLGRTKISACSVKLNGDGTCSKVESKDLIPDSLRTAKTSAELFGFIADHLKKFLDEYHPEHCDIPADARDRWYNMGFIFRFPVQQTKINAGKLLRWAKGYKIEVSPP